MQASMLILSNVFNFIPCSQSPPPIRSSINILSQFHHIHSLLLEFIQTDQDSKYVFEELKLFLIKEEEISGPRKFKKLVQNISSVVLEYVVLKFRNQEVDRGVLCLTYFQKNCSKYMTVIINVFMNFAYCLAQFSKKTFSAMARYLVESKQMITICKDPIQGDLQLLQNAFEGVYFFHAKKLSKSKSIFSQMISKITSRIHEQQLKTKEMQPLTITLFVLSTYFMSKTYREIGDIDISDYNLTQCYQFAQSYLPDSEYLVEMGEGSMFALNRRVKLSRIENKIERIKSLHFSSKGQSAQSSFQNTTKQSQVNEFKIKTKVTKDVKVQPKVMRKELDHLSILDQKKEYALKKRTLKALKGEAETRETKINYYEHQIEGFNSQKVSIHQYFKLDQHKEEIVSIQHQKSQLKSEIREKMWEVVGTLKPTKKLQTYFKSFKAAIHYQSTNKFYRFLCSEMSIMGQITIFVMFKRFKNKMKRVLIRTIIVKGIRHQIEFLKHKIDGTHHIKVYNIQSGPGVDDCICVQEDLFTALQINPLEYYFECVDRKLIPIKTYLSSLSTKLVFQVKLFYTKLHKQVLRKKDELTYYKKQVFLTFQQFKTDLSYTLFVITQKMKNGLYNHSIERIDTNKHQNEDYNIKFIKQIKDHPSMILYESDLDKMLTDYITQKKQKHMHLITKIQSKFRWKVCHKLMKKQKEGMAVMTAKINENLFTLTINGMNRNFFIEHLQNKYPIVILKAVEFNSLSFVNKLREKLLQTDDCQKHLKIIEKYFALRNIYRKLTHKTKQLQLENNFSTKFKISLCFAKKTKQILYKNKKIDVSAMYMLTVRDFQVCPRTYLLRIFNLKAESLYTFDIEMKIYMPEKLFLESNLDNIYEHIDIIGYKQAEILMEGPAKSIPKSRRINSKSTIFSNYSFGSGEEFGKEKPTKQRLINRLQNRESFAFTRNKKNSINFKMRHKTALKQKDILLIRKWIQDCHDNFNVSEESEISS